MKAFFYTCLFVLSMTTVSWSQVYVASSGTIKVVSTGTLYTSGALENNGILDTDGDVYYLSDLVNNSNMLTAGGRSYFISPTLANQNISGTSSTVLFNNLTINLTAPGAEGVLVNNNMGVFVNQEINLQSGDFRLAGEAQLIQTHSGNSMVLGNSVILIDQQGTGDVYDFNYWSLPVHQLSGSYSLTANLFDGTNSSANPFQKLAINFVPGLDGTPGTPVSISSYWLFKFINRAGSDPNGFQQVNPTDNLSPGQGFTMKGSGAGASQNYVLSGLPNDGDYNHLVSANNFSIIGNPYPSALDADVFINANLASFEPGTGLHFWDHFGGGTHVQRGYQGGYAVYTLAGGTPAFAHPDVDQTIPFGTRTPGRFIPVGQAFFVQADSLSGGTFTFTNAQRAFFRKSDTGPNPKDTSVFFKANLPSDDKKAIGAQTNVSKSINTTKGKIRLGHTDEQKFYRQLLLDFNPANTSGIDSGYDALMLDVFTTDIYWLSEEKKLVIQSLPFLLGETIPLGIVSENDSFHEFKLDEISGIDSPIYLYDSQTETYHQLSDKPVRVWVEKGKHNQQFFISFEQKTLSLGEEINSFTGLKVFYNSTEGAIQIENSVRFLDRVEIFSLSGQSLGLQTNINAIATSFSFKTVATGIYLVKVYFANGGITTKKVVKY